TRTYRATDACGLSNTCTQSITVSNTVKPTLTCPAAMTVQCATQMPAPDVTKLPATVACGNTLTAVFVSDSPLGTCPTAITRTYRATDACGLSNTCTQTITVSNTVKPTLTCPAAVTVQCASQIPAPDTSKVTATDACGNTLT